MNKIRALIPTVMMIHVWPLIDVGVGNDLQKQKQRGVSHEMWRSFQFCMGYSYHDCAIAGMIHSSDYNFLLCLDIF
jgi:hypothetical protein